MTFGDADLRVGAEVQLASEHEGDDAREVGPERQPLQLVHQLDVLVEAFGDAGRPLERRAARSLLRFSTPEIRRSTSRTESTYSSTAARSVGPSRCCRRLKSSMHRIEDAAVAAAPARHAAPRVPPSPNSRSNTTRGLFSVGSGVVGVRPRERVQIGAAVAVLALADEEVQIDRELERRQRRVLAEHRRRNLIGGDAVADVGAFGVLADGRRSATCCVPRV